MRNSPPNDEEQISIESTESSQDSVSADTNDSGIDLGEFVADTIELVSSILSDQGKGKREEIFNH